MTGPITKSSLAHGFRVFLARRSADGWAAAAETAELIPVSVMQWLAPKFHQAGLEFAPADRSRYPWGWRDVAGIDDRLWICTDHADPQQRGYLFDGYIAEARLQMDGAAASVRYTANSAGSRLSADTILYGQHRWAISGDLVHCTGLPLVFNPGGKGNRHPDLYTPEDFPADAKNGTAGVGVFCDPGSEGAKPWTWVEALDYLQWLCNADQTHVYNALFTRLDYDLRTPLHLESDLTGMRLWEALARIAGVAGYDIYEQLSPPDASDDGSEGGERPPTHQLTCVRAGEGTRRALSLQVPDALGGREVLDPEATNLFAATITWDAASAVPCPVAAGGRPLYEVAIPLVRGWDPAQLDASAYADPKASADQTYSLFARRYTTGGKDFPLYAEVGRLWKIDPDLDLAELCGQEAMGWPAYAFKALAPLEGGYGKAAAPSVAQWSLDGKIWNPLAAEPLEDGTGIRVTAENLAALCPQEISGGGPPNPYTQNFWHNILTVQVRIVGCVPSPMRTIEAPARRAGAGSAFDRAAWIDAGAAHQVRRRLSSSPYYAGPYPCTGESDGRDANGQTLAQLASRLQEVHEGLLVHAELTMEWIDPDYGLTDVIERIEGAEAELGVNLGAGRAYPRIVGVRYDLQGYSQSLVLETDREAAVA